MTPADSVVDRTTPTREHSSVAPLTRPLRIAYVGHIDCARDTGVLKKVRDQLRRWTAAGHSAQLFAAAPGSQVSSVLDGFAVQVVRRSSRWGHAAQMRRLTDRVAEWQPNVVYLRWGIYYPSLESLARRFPVVAEVNTDDVAEYRRELVWPKYCYHRMLRGRLIARVAGAVAVTAELAHRWPANCEVIGNGIDLSSIDILPLPSNPAPRAVFLGSPNLPWHGIDQLVELAVRLPTWTFDVVGYDPGQIGSAVPPNVRCHGYLERVAYERVVQRADIAVGTLALHRKRMNEACPLKLREYLAYGVPCVIAHDDPDFPDAVPFLLRVPNRDAGVLGAVPAIRRFAAKWRGRRVERRWIQHIDSRGKEMKRLELLRSFAN